MFDRKNRLGTALIGAALAIPAASVSYAADRKIEEVVVTAERQESTVQDTSISITAFTDQFLDDFGIRNQEDLQNFVPATTIQPYDATIRGVGRNFRALGGDPGVATYMNNVYSEDLLTATAATFWDVQRIEVLRGPQGTLYGRNAVGGAINILYKEPTHELDYGFKVIGGNFGTQEYYGMVNGSIIEDVLAARLNFSVRDRDGIIEEGGSGDDLDGLGTENVAVQFKWTPTENLEFNVRANSMQIDRVFGGANGGGLVVLNENGLAQRNTTDIVPGFRAIDTSVTDLSLSDQNNFYDQNTRIETFTDPTTGAAIQAQPNRLGIDIADFDGFQNAAASMDGFNETSPESAARLNECVFDGDISGSDVCAFTNGLQQEEFDQQGVQFNASWTVTDTLELKYIYGYNKLSYERTTDDDNTNSEFHDRQFYVNHEARYTSHELQAFYEFGDSLSFTSGIFFYDATIDQRGDYYSAATAAGADSRYANPYVDNTSSALLGGLSGGAAFYGATQNGNGSQPVTLHSAKNICQTAATPAASCAVNFASDNPAPAANNNLHISQWYGDDGSHPDLNVQHGIDSVGSDLLYHTQTVRKAFAAYTQGVWDINDVFTLTVGIRYAEDEIDAEENLFRYVEAAGASVTGVFGSLAAYNRANGGLVTGADGIERGTPLAVNGGIPAAISVYRPFTRIDRKTTGRVNLDWNVTDSTLLYLSATSGYRSGGNNLVFFSATPDYDPEELLAYEFGYKTQLFDDSLQLNGSFYYYDYENIHTVAREVTPPLVPGGAPGTTTSVLEAPGAEIMGIEAEVLWLASENWTVGGNFSYTPSEYTKDLFIQDPAQPQTPESLFPDFNKLTQNINGNQILQVPELKYTAWASYGMELSGGSRLDFFGVYSWIDEVYYSPFESESEKAESYDRTDLRATWTSASSQWVVAGYVNNVFDDVGVLQVLRNGEDEGYRQSSGVTSPRQYGVELSYMLGQ